MMFPRLLLPSRLPAVLCLLLLAGGCTPHNDTAAMHAWIDNAKQAHALPVTHVSSTLEGRTQVDDLPGIQLLADPFHPTSATDPAQASADSASNDASADRTPASHAAVRALTPPIHLLGTVTRAGEAYAVLAIGDSTLSLKAGDTLPEQSGKLLRVDLAGADIQTPAGVQHLAFAQTDPNPATTMPSPPPRVAIGRQPHRRGAAS